MSDYHILTQDPKKKTVQVVFHIPIPSKGTNAAGISWQDAMVKEQGGTNSIVSQLSNISSEEESALKSGALVEVVKTVRFSSTSLSNDERKAEIEAAFEKAKKAIFAEKQIVLEWMGYEGNVKTGG